MRKELNIFYKISTHILSLNNWVKGRKIHKKESKRRVKNKWNNKKQLARWYVNPKYLLLHRIPKHTPI